MPVPEGYDIGLEHPNINGGVVVGWLLDERDDEAFRETQAVVAHVDTTTAGVSSVASYGLGQRTYQARIPLRTDVRTRAHRPSTESPTVLRTILLAFAATTDGATILHLASGERSVAFTETITFISGPPIDGYIAIVTMTDLGPA